MEPLGDLKVKTEINLSLSPIKQEPNVDNIVEENIEVLTDMQKHTSECKMSSLRPEHSVGNHSRYDPEEDHLRSHSPPVNSDRESKIFDESEKDCKPLTLCSNPRSPSQDAPPEFEKVFVKVEDAHASSDEEPVEQKFWNEQPCVGQEPQPGCSSWSDEVDHQRGRDLYFTTVHNKGGSHQDKDLADDPPETNYPEVSVSKTISLNNALTMDEVDVCGFDQKEYLSIPVEVIDEETKTSTMKQVDKEMLRATRSEQSITKNSSKNKLAMKNYVCGICDFETPTLKIFKGHMMKEHSDQKQFHCKYCDYKCFRSSSLKVHERIHTGEKPYECKLCDYKFTQLSSLKVHKRIHTGEKPYNCKLCDYKFAQLSALEVHERSHTGEKPYNCKLCDYKCSQLSHLKSHEKNHTGEKPFNCKFCDFRCSSSSYLKVHERNHTGETPYFCKLCDFKSIQSSNLKDHERIHSGEKPFKCKFCDFKSSRLSNLKVHERLHTGEYPLHCEFCDYKCSSFARLKVHQRTHTGEKPYLCKFCDYKCSRSSGLAIHERTHTGEKPYHCEFCDYKCSNRALLKRHKTTHTLDCI